MTLRVLEDLPVTAEVIARLTVVGSHRRAVSGRGGASRDRNRQLTAFIQRFNTKHSTFNIRVLRALETKNLECIGFHCFIQPSDFRTRTHLTTATRRNDATRISSQAR